MPGAVQRGRRGQTDENVAVFLASDQASGMTGTTVNLTMGSLDDSRLSDRGRSSVLA
ncbi:MAG: SDR family oxidoreductase [Chloroflexi bacterium]|nr:MAG: SDR family oxidoreductase [Chloroflexota bacterium]